MEKQVKKMMNKSRKKKLIKVNPKKDMHEQPPKIVDYSFLLQGNTNLAETVDKNRGLFFDYPPLSFNAYT